LTLRSWTEAKGYGDEPELPKTNKTATNTFFSLFHHHPYLSVRSSVWDIAKANPLRQFNQIRKKCAA
jgi:hypothetical protein